MPPLPIFKKRSQLSRFSEVFEKLDRILRFLFTVRMSSHDLFFDAVDIGVVKAEPLAEYLGGAEQEQARGARTGGREGEDGHVNGDSTGQRAPPPRPQQTPQPAAAVAAPPLPPPPPTPPAALAANPITASELRLAASTVFRLAVEAIDALHGLKEVVSEVAGDVRELLEATRRAGGGLGVGRRRRSVTARRSSGGGGLGVRTRAQARRRR